MQCRASFPIKVKVACTRPERLTGRDGAVLVIVGDTKHIRTGPRVHSTGRRVRKKNRQGGPVAEISCEIFDYFRENWTCFSLQPGSKTHRDVGHT